MGVLMNTPYRFPMLLFLLHKPICDFMSTKVRNKQLIGKRGALYIVLKHVYFGVARKRAQAPPGGGNLDLVPRAVGPEEAKLT